MKDAVELDRLPVGQAMPVVNDRAVDGAALSLSGSAFGVATLPSQDHIAAGSSTQDRMLSRQPLSQAIEVTHRSFGAARYVTIKSHYSAPNVAQTLDARPFCL